MEKPCLLTMPLTTSKPSLMIVLQPSQTQREWLIQTSGGAFLNAAQLENGVTLMMTLIMLLADEWLTPDEAKVRLQQQHQDASQCPTPTDWDPNHFQWRRQQPPPSTTIAGLVERENLGQSSLLTTSGASAAHHVSFSSESPTWDPRHTPCRSPSILWDNQHQPSILWDNQHQSFGTININICQSNHPMLLMPRCLCVWHPTGPDEFTNNHQC